MNLFLPLSQLPYSLSTSEAVTAISLIVFFLALNGLLHALEAGIASLRRVRIEALEEQGDSNAQKFKNLYENQQTYFASCQVGFQLARLSIVGVGFLLAPALAERIGGQQYNALMLVFALALIIIPLALLNLLVAELMFRGLGKRAPESWVLKGYPVLQTIRVLFSPAVWVVRGIGSLLMRKLKLGQVFAPQVLTEQELVEMITAKTDQGDLIEDEREMIHSIIEFTDTVAREIMTPRTDINSVEVTADAAELVQMIRETGHSRIPIYEDTIDRILGIVHAKDLLNAISGGNGCEIREIMRPAYFIPESKSLHELLQEFRRGRTQLAIVQDEYGGTSGLVTIEDVVEEIVGDIVDEYDVEEQAVQFLDDGSWLIQGKTHLWDVNAEIGSHFESEEFDTLGGFLFGLFGRQPEAGDFIESNGWTLTVAETDGRRVQTVTLKKNAPVRSESS